METENKDWKPEVGKHVWVVENYAILQKKVLRVDPSHCALLRGRRGDDFYEGFKCHPTPEAALASIKIYDLDGKEVLIPRASPIFDGKHLHRFLRDEAGHTECLDSEIKWYSAEVPQKDPNEKTWENVVDAYSTFKEARMGHQEFYRYMDSQLDELVRSRKYVHTMKMLHEGGGAANGGKSDQREG